MKCLRCGYCCVEYMVVIVNDPSKGPEDMENLVCKESGKRCKHLVGDAPGKYLCAIHDYPWYKETPCFSHGQIERNPTNLCRMGKHILKNRGNPDGQGLHIATGLSGKKITITERNDEPSLRAIKMGR